MNGFRKIVACCFNQLLKSPRVVSGVIVKRKFLSVLETGTILLIEKVGKYVCL